ncbi:hypothetical protein C9J12_16770 [Photobacterium frigidiphilum]|uniref:GGDEF domain-containing protein n=1 Tax=Photobacterium frigidiphilum TaxID=264736 RepID=A0A2T3JD85_9GAMM|nr:diguanylate cyclase [Photobacterium frigidiphilum]PSU46862.1 hypothetical protein C9J12_16770 [Photobacterium frigidiphilum]
MSLKKKLLLLLTLLFLLFFANVAFVHILESKSEDKLLWVNHTHQVLSTSDKLLISLADAETGQRGYLLTNDRHYLEPYLRAIKVTEDLLFELKRLTADNPKQQTLLKALEIDIDKKCAELKQSIDLFETDSTAALQLVSSDVGKQYMDNIRWYLLSFSSEENRLLEKRKGDYREVRAYISTIIIIEVLAMLFLAVFTFTMINKNLFEPLLKLIMATKKMEKGERQSVTDYLPKDEIGYLMASFYKMSEVVFDKHQQLQDKAHTDELTGVKNRLGLHQEIDNAIDNAKREGTNLALCFLDLDGFKQINDEMGHDCGDELLKTVATRLRHTLRSSDVIYRYGGDEFIVLLKGVRTIGNVHRVVESILSNVANPFVYKGRELPVKFSLGVAVAPDDAAESDQLIEYADIAMYESKREMKQQAKFFCIDMLKKVGDKC